MSGIKLILFPDIVHDRQEVEMLPSHRDVEGASFGIARLHSLYGINTQRMVQEGIIETHFNNKDVLSVPSVMKFNSKFNSIFRIPKSDFLSRAIFSATFMLQKVPFCFLDVRGALSLVNLRRKIWAVVPRKKSPSIFGHVIISRNFSLQNSIQHLLELICVKFVLSFLCQEAF